MRAPPASFVSRSAKYSRRRPADVLVQEPVELGLERRVGLRLAVRRVELFEGEHQRFGDEPAAVGAEPAAGVGDVRRREWSESA